MKILYFSCYPKEYFNFLENHAIREISQPSQKFNWMILQGINNNSVAVDVLNSYDQKSVIDHSFHENIITVSENKIDYYFIPSISNSKKNRKDSKKNIKKFLEKYTKYNSDLCIIVDVLKPYAEYVYRYANGVPVISIITDIPKHLVYGCGIKGIIRNLYKQMVFMYMVKKSNGFVFLTEEMNKLLNKKKKDYIIMEGLVDASSIQQINSCEARKGNVVLYSGALHVRYGIAKVIEAFKLNELKSYELHLYGTGDYEKNIKEICLQTQNIKYFGVVSNDEVIKKQMEADILINPRPINEEFVKYSFPSKNMEYMLSGTPVLTSNLPGMPEEYKKYVMLLDVTSSDSIKRGILQAFNIPVEKRNQMGIAAKRFIESKKGNTVQARRIIEMAEMILQKGSDV